MKQTLVTIGWILLGVAIALCLAAAFAYADSGLDIAPGATYASFADVSVSTSCSQVLPANTDHRMDAVLCNTGTTNVARCAGSGASSTQGTPLAANYGCATLPTSSAITCCAASGTTTIAPAEIDR